MAQALLDALSRLAAHRFGSFADAATSVLDLVERAAPGGALVLGQVDWDSGAFRVIDARGETAPRGTTLPLATGVPDGSSAVAELLDPADLAALGRGPWAAAPLDASDGRIVGLVLAAGADGEAPPRELGQLLLLAARLLSYEWESISTRAELRRLSELARDRAHTDPVTGLPDRAALLEAVDREWELARRGTMETYLVVCEVRDHDRVVARVGDAAANLLLKDVAEVLGGGVRRTDHLARVAETRFAAALVGCKGANGARAFIARFERAFARSAEARPAEAALAYGILSLTEGESAAEALELAEAAAGAAPVSAGPAAFEGMTEEGAA